MELVLHFAQHDFDDPGELIKWTGEVADKVSMGGI